MSRISRTSLRLESHVYRVQVLCLSPITHVPGLSGCRVCLNLRLSECRVSHVASSLSISIKSRDSSVSVSLKSRPRSLRISRMSRARASSIAVNSSRKRSPMSTRPSLVATSHQPRYQPRYHIRHPILRTGISSVLRLSSEALILSRANCCLDPRDSPGLSNKASASSGNSSRIISRMCGNANSS